jgi:hypothetical protein
MAINSKSKLRDILADPRAAAILNEVVPGLDENPALGPCMGMRLSTLLKFPQVSVSPEDQKKLIEQLDALDA